MNEHLKRFLAVSALLAAYIFAMQWALRTPAKSAEWAPVDMNRTIDQTNFVVNSGCSGTLIDTIGLYILTAHHCVADQYETIERESIDEDGVVTKEKVRKLRDGTVSQISFKGSESIKTVVYKVRLVAGDRNKDLALLQIKSATVPATLSAKMACDPPVRGERIFTVGNPMGLLYSSVTTGIISSLQRDYDMIGLGNETGTEPLMQVSGGVVGGNSGGSVYNASGEFIGVPVLAHRVNEVIAFAVPLNVVKEFLTANKLGRLFDRCTPKDPEQ